VPEIPEGFPLAIRQLLTTPMPSYDPSNQASVTELTMFSMEMTFAAQELAHLSQLIRLRRDQVIQVLGGTVSDLVAMGVGFRGAEGGWGQSI
jgi:hypothetical protein